MRQKAPDPSNAVCGFAVFTSLDPRGFVMEFGCFVAASIVASCRKLRQSSASTCGDASTVAARTGHFLPAYCILWTSSFKESNSTGAYLGNRQPALMSVNIFLILSEN